MRAWTVTVLFLAACLGGCTSVHYTTRPTQPVRLVTHGRSMEPTLHEGQTITVTPVDYDTLRAGQMVTYENLFARARGGQTITVTHRLKRYTDHGWVTQGDNNPTEDMGLCTAANLWGVVGP